MLGRHFPCAGDRPHPANCTPPIAPGFYRARYAAGYAVPHPLWYQGPRGVPMQVWVYMPREVTVGDIHVGAIVRRNGVDRLYRVLLIIIHGPGAHEAEAVLEPIDESWVRRIIAPVANLEVCSE